MAFNLKLWTAEPKSNSFTMVREISEIETTNKLGQTDESRGTICLCSQIRSIWRLSQMCGVNPLSIQCEGTKERKNGISERPRRSEESVKCRLVKVKKSYAFIASLYSVLFFTVSACVMFEGINVIVDALFKGTDAYAFKIHVAGRISQALVLQLCGLTLSGNLIGGWKLIQNISRALKHQFPNYIRIWSRSLTLISLLVGISNAFFLGYLSLRFCTFAPNKVNTVGTVGIDHSYCNEFNIPYHTLVAWTLCSTEFCHTALASLQFIFALIIQSLHKRLAELLKERFQVDTSSEPGMHLELEDEITRLRLLYEEICDAIICLRKFFGLSALVICCDSILTCIFGFYWRIIYFENLDAKKMDNGNNAAMHHFILFSLQSGYSTLSLCLVLVSGQIFVNSSFEAIRAIRKSRLSGITSAAKFQSAAGFPTKFSVYSITNIEMPFLASAATNVITYLLVMMQFRLEQREELEEPQ